jgi:basic membrane lipoprotein Med (substrate-binding protein (PBP1-ABC) superfamily)
MLSNKLEFINTDTQFSGSFEAGVGKNISQELIENKKVELIFPVAGPQVGDTLEVIKNSNSECLVVGVDVDQTQKFEMDKKKIIVSAIKNMEFMIIQKIYNRYDCFLKPDYSRETNEKDKAKENWEKNNFGDNAIGISENGEGFEINKEISTNK